MRVLLALVIAFPLVAVASPWMFSAPLTLAGEAGPPHYHHLDGAGRRHVAADDAQVAVAWEDDSSGAPQVYLARKSIAAADFAAPERLSDGDEAYEPAVVALGGGQWLAAWEQDGAVVARAIGAAGAGPRLELAGAGSRQITLAARADGEIAAVWARDRDGGQLLEAAVLRVRDDGIVVSRPTAAVAPVDTHPYQGFPSAAWLDDGTLLVAWEDRRAGHTRLFAARRDGDAGFGGEVQLNEHSAPTENGREVTGLGSGVMRVVLAAHQDRVRAIWLDKRNAASGYAVWGAASDDGGRSFGRNTIVQDEHGAVVQQWHAALAAGSPGFVAAWDDTREAWSDDSETGDVLLSWHDDGAWSADLLVPGASGPGYQGSPTITLDPRGDLHLVWIERDDLSSPSRLRYLHGRLQAAGD